MSACDPLIQAERRFKARCLNRSRWDLFPCRGSVVPCRTLSLVSATCHGNVKPGCQTVEVQDALHYLPDRPFRRVRLELPLWSGPLACAHVSPKKKAQAGVPVPQNQSSTLISELLLACAGRATHRACRFAA